MNKLHSIIFLAGAVACVLMGVLRSQNKGKIDAALVDLFERFPDRRAGYNKTMMMISFYLSVACLLLAAVIWFWTPSVLAFCGCGTVLILPALIYTYYYRVNLW